MAFAAHLIIALIFIIALYLTATYSGLRYELSEIHDLETKIHALLTERYQLFNILVGMTALKDNNSSALAKIEHLRSQALGARSQQELIATENSVFIAIEALCKAWQENLRLTQDHEVSHQIEALSISTKQLKYHLNNYNIAIESFSIHKKSLFAAPVLGWFKVLNQSFEPWTLPAC